MQISLNFFIFYFLDKIPHFNAGGGTGTDGRFYRAATLE